MRCVVILEFVVLVYFVVGIVGCSVFMNNFFIDVVVIVVV